MIRTEGGERRKHKIHAAVIRHFRIFGVPMTEYHPACGKGRSMTEDRAQVTCKPCLFALKATPPQGDAT
jgi:hypothetical protein